VFSIAVPAEQLRPITDENCRRDTDAVLARFASAFGDIRFEVMWQSDSLNAQAFRLGPVPHVWIHGGLARHCDIGPEGLALAIAHEVGHHKGGPPVSRHYSWLSTDRRADEWVRTVGLPAVFGTDAVNIARAGASQLFCLLADLVEPGEEPPCADDRPCLSCRARSFGATIKGRHCE
jgi:hypothetical protein